MSKNTEKFKFGIDFQELILKYTVTDKKGYKLLHLYKDSYFALLEHAVVAYALKKYFKNKKKVPSKPVLKETLRSLYESDHKLYSALHEKDRELIGQLVDSLYLGTCPDPDSIYESCVKFAQRIAFKDELENIDVNDSESFEASVDKLKKALSIGSEIAESLGTFVVSGMKDRAYRRDSLNEVYPTPFYQFNQLTNSGGLSKGNLVMLMSEAKRFKTGMLLNIAKYYLRKKKRILYIDLENGEDPLVVRTEQSIMEASQMEIISGNYDRDLMKLFRKYARIGSELVIKRMPAYLTTTNDIQNFIEKVYLETGIRFDLGIIDYGDLLGATTGQVDETRRISDAYVDMKNLANYNSWEAIFTASHVKNEASKRRGTKYVQNDVAKCLDKMRHVDVALGLQENDEEIENGVMRIEVIEQRNGMREGKMLFWVDIEKQNMREFTKSELRDYYQQMGEESPDDKRQRKKNQEKSKKGGGDL